MSKLKIEISDFNFKELFDTTKFIIDKIEELKKKRRLSPPTYSPKEPELGTHIKKQRPTGAVYQKINSNHMPDSPFKSKMNYPSKIFSPFSPPNTPKSKKRENNREDMAYSPYSPIKYT